MRVNCFRHARLTTFFQVSFQTAFIATFLTALTGAFSSTALASEWDASASIAAEARVFTEQAAFDQQEDEPQLSLFSTIELDGDTELGRFAFEVFGRLDSVDDRRTHLDIREAFWQQGYADVDVLVGVNKVFWGVAESRHLVNIINTVDAVEYLDGEDFLGQPMVNLDWYTDVGKLSVFALPWHRAQPFVGENSRFRVAPVPVSNEAQYTGGASEDYLSLALRYSHYFGDWDVGASFFHGVSRDPSTFEVQGTVAQTPDGPVFVPESLVPVYELINQAGLDAQLTTDDWLYKVEAIVREGQGDTFAATVGGFEYTLYQLFDSDKDLGLILEYNYDGRDPDTVLNNDVFSGLRLAWNDTQSTELLVGAFVDAKDASTVLRAEASRRFFEHWTASLEAQLFANIDQDNVIDPFAQDDFVTLSVEYYF